MSTTRAYEIRTRVCASIAAIRSGAHRRVLTQLVCSASFSCALTVRSRAFDAGPVRVLEHRRPGRRYDRDPHGTVGARDTDRLSRHERTGFSFAPTVKGFAYRDVRDVQIIRRETDDRDFNAWLVTFKDGRTHEIDPGDLWD